MVTYQDKIAWLREHCGDTVMLPGFWRAVSPLSHRWLWIDEVDDTYEVWVSRSRNVGAAGDTFLSVINKFDGAQIEAYKVILSLWRVEGDKAKWVHQYIHDLVCEAYQYNKIKSKQTKANNNSNLLTGAIVIFTILVWILM